MKLLLKETAVVTAVITVFSPGFASESKELLQQRLFHELGLFFEYLHFGIVIVLGAIALMLVKENLTVKKGLRSFSSSIFAGTLALFLGLSYDIDRDLLIVAVGLASWGGDRSLGLIEKLLKAKLQDRKSK